MATVEIVQDWLYASDTVWKKGCLLFSIRTFTSGTTWVVRASQAEPAEFRSDLVTKRTSGLPSYTGRHVGRQRLGNRARTAFVSFSW